MDWGRRGRIWEGRAGSGKEGQDQGGKRIGQD